MKFSAVLLFLTVLVGQMTNTVGNHTPAPTLAPTVGPPPNDECPDAISLSLNTTVSGNTNMAQPDGTFNFCGTWFGGAPGTWKVELSSIRYKEKHIVFLSMATGRENDAGYYQLTVTELPPPPNDQCPGAVSLNVDTPVSGSTLPAQPDGTFEFCETYNWGNAAPGVWYEIEGNGDRFSADTCASDFDTKLHVYQGDSCETLTCIDGSAWYTSCGGGNSRVFFDTVQGETYHILVHGAWEQAVGTYQLTVTAFVPPSNDECPGAVSLSLNTPVSGDTFPAQSDGNFDFCGASYQNAPGVWYQIVGNGNRFSAETCGSDYNTMLHVYHGDRCDALTCIDGDAHDSSCGWMDSRVTFDTVQGETYHILVHGTWVAAAGTYQLTVTELPPRPNDECPGAVSLSLDTPVSGSTLAAQSDSTFDFCETYNWGNAAPGVWYEIVGNGDRFSADTCGSEYNTKLHVYQGDSCETLTCIGGNDNAYGDCGDGSRIVFDTVQGERYRILVHGASEAAAGTYQLTVTEFPPPSNDECPGAVSLSINTPASGDTLTAQSDGNFDFCGTDNWGDAAPGVWYQIVGNGNPFTASTCGSQFDTKLHVYQGDSCETLTCIHGNDNYYDYDDPSCSHRDSRVAFHTVSGETYRILVHGFVRNGLTGSSDDSDTDDSARNYQLTVSGAERTESGGDPHFTTWKQEHYEYHGQCDLVMLKDDNFADGLGIDIHIRTKLVRYWSYIKSVAIKIGHDILEIEGSASADDDQAHYWMNYEYQGELESIAGFPVTQKLPSTYKRSYTIDLSSKYPGQDITVQLYKEFVRVKINGEEMAFGNSVGLMGDYKTGKTLARGGVTVLDDFTELGDEWQVLPSDARLFREASHPQFPELCIKPEDPRGERQRRLDESEITVEQAESACASLKDALAIKDCVYDILATQDLDMVGAF